MSARARARRRGLALLLVLALLVVALGAAAGTARVGAAARMDARLQEDEALAEDLHRAAEAPILAWLRSGAGRAVVPPDGRAPRVPVASAAWREGGRGFSVRVDAWDQCGMLPARGVPAFFSAHRSERAAEAAGRLRAIEGTLGLDTLRAGAVRVPVFPRAGLDALGAELATHNPPGGGPNAPIWININTAPPELVGAALRAAGRGGIEAIVEARREGRAAPMPPATDRGQAGGVRLVGASGAWAFRVDVRAGAVRRAWWLVCTNTGADWEVVQRLAIRE